MSSVDPVSASIQRTIHCKVDPDYKGWWNELPELSCAVEPKQFAWDDKQEVDTEFVKVGGGPRAIWDRWMRLGGMPTLKHPTFVIGILVILFGLVGFTTAATGFRIPHLEFISDYAPASLFLSITLMRTGVMLMSFSAKMSRYKREEAQNVRIYTERLMLEQNQGMKVKNLEERVQETRRRNATLPPSRRYTQPEYAYYLALMSENPQIEPPKHPRTPYMTEELTFHEKCLPTMGVADMVLGKMMLLAGIFAVAVIFLPNSLPSTFDLFTKDPALSVAVSLILLSSSISALKNGAALIGHRQNKHRRDLLEYSLRCLNDKAEAERVGKFHENLIQHLPIGSDTHTRAEQVYRLYLKRPKPELPKKPQVGAVSGALHKMARTVTPKLSGASVILGMLITMVGLAVLGMTLSGHIPKDLSFLTHNTSLSIAFSSILVITGLHAWHRGVMISEEKRTREREKATRELLTELPALPAHKKSEKPLPTNLEHALVLDTAHPTRRRDEAQKKIAHCAKTMMRKGHNLGLKSLRGLWLPDAALGAFLMFCGIAGLVFCLPHVHCPHALEFIIKDPHYSMAFCFSMIAIGFSAIETSYSVATVRKNRREERDDYDVLKAAARQILGEKMPLPLDQKV